MLDVIAQWTGWTLWRGKYKGDVIKYSVCRSTLRLGILPGKKNTPDAFHPGADSDCLLCQSSLPEHLAAHASILLAVYTACFILPFVSQLKKAGREQRGIRDKGGTRALLQTGVLYSKGVCKNRMH